LSTFSLSGGFGCDTGLPLAETLSFPVAGLPVSSRTALALLSGFGPGDSYPVAESGSVVACFFGYGAYVSSLGDGDP